MKIKRGTKVICIDDNFSNTSDEGIDARIKLFDELPRKGQKYTIRDIYVYGDGAIGITVEELKNPPLPDLGIEPNFAIRRFALQEVKEVSIEKEEQIEELV